GTGVVEAAVGPVAVRAEHPRQRPRLALGPVEAARDVVAGGAGEEDLLDGGVVAVDLAVNDRGERRLLRHGPQAEGAQHLLAQLLPGLVARRHGHEEVLGVEGAQLREPAVGGELARLANAERLAARCVSGGGGEQGEEDEAGGSLHGAAPWGGWNKPADERTA